MDRHRRDVLVIAGLAAAGVGLAALGFAALLGFFTDGGSGGP
jgi:hypothetical protein